MIISVAALSGLVAAGVLSAEEGSFALAAAAVLPAAFRYVESEAVRRSRDTDEDRSDADRE